MPVGAAVDAVCAADSTQVAQRPRQASGFGLVAAPLLGEQIGIALFQRDKFTDG